MLPNYSFEGVLTVAHPTASYLLNIVKQRCFPLTFSSSSFFFVFYSCSCAKITTTCLVKVKEMYRKHILITHDELVLKLNLLIGIYSPFANKKKCNKKNENTNKNRETIFFYLHFLYLHTPLFVLLIYLFTLINYFANDLILQTCTYEIKLINI